MARSFARLTALSLFVLAAGSAAGCGDSSGEGDGTGSTDGGGAEGGGGGSSGGDDAASEARDAAPLDDGASSGDGALEGGSDEVDGSDEARDGSSDAGAVDASTGDASPSDGGAHDGGASDGGMADGGAADGGAGDGGLADGGAADAGSPFPGGCISGASGHYAARARWAGNGAGSRAYVQHELHNLPDRSRWRVGAYSRGPIGYEPRFTDTFLGGGGLEMGGSVFMDVELSTAQLTTIRHVTLAILGRSYATSASGSFSWMSFDGSGATPIGFVSNVAPYRWYLADATSALNPGNSRVLLRIMPGGPSSVLVVSRVEICIDGE